MKELANKLLQRGITVAGVLSGTSGDGIDVAIVDVRADDRGRVVPPALRAFETVAFSRDLHARVRRALDGGATTFREVALLSRDLGRAFGAAARDVARKNACALDLVGSHGQTVYHHDGGEESGPATLQLGDGDCVSEEAGAPVVSDFRQRDIAAGGEGAPLSALADDLVFARAPRPCAILNLGGMANLTWLGAEPDDVRAFDTGPANALLDGLARRMLDRPFDADGALALGGRVRDGFLRELASHPFFSKPPPRSTGRDTFGEPWIDSVIDRARAIGVISDRMLAIGVTSDRARSIGVRSDPARRAATQDALGARRDDGADLMATAVELVAWCVGDALRRFLPSATGDLYVAGGGVHNRALTAALERQCARRVVPSDAVGVPVDAREGLVFAVLAARFVLGVAVSHASVTGARAGRILGKYSPANVAPSRAEA